MTIAEAKKLIGLRESDTITKDNIDGLLTLRRNLLQLSNVWSRNKYDVVNDKKQIEAIDFLLKELK